MALTPDELATNGGGPLTPEQRERNTRIQNMVSVMHTSASPTMRAFAGDLDSLLREYVRLQLQVTLNSSPGVLELMGGKPCP